MKLDPVVGVGGAGAASIDMVGLARLDGDTPAGGAGGQIASKDIASDGNKTRRCAVAFEFADGGLGGVALGDGTEIQAHAAGGETGASGIEFEIAPVDEGTCGGELIGRGHAIGVLSLCTPEESKGAHGGVKGAVGACGEEPGMLEQCGQMWADGGPCSGSSASSKGGEGVIDAVIAGLVFDGGEGSEGGSGGGLGLGFCGGVEGDSCLHPHHDSGKVETLILRVRAAAQGEQQGESDQQDSDC